MKKLFRSPDYFSVLRYACAFALFILFNHLETTVLPYSAAVFIAAVSTGGSVLALAVLYISSFALSGAYGLLAQAAITAGFIIFVDILYSRFSVKKSAGFIALCCLSLAGYVFLGDTSAETVVEKRILVALITVGLSFFCTLAGKAATEKGLKFKLSYEETLSIFAVIVATGLGVCNAFSPLIWKGVVAFLILCACYLLKFGIGAFFSSILGISLAIFYHDVNYVAITLCLGLAADASCRFSRYLAAVSLPVIDFFLFTAFGAYRAYAPVDYLPVVVGAVAFITIPNKPLKALK